MEFKTEEMHVDPALFYEGAVPVTHDVAWLTEILGAPSSIDELARDVRDLHSGNNFSTARAPFVHHLRALSHALFERYAPGAALDVLEIGPGPRAYAFTRGLLPMQDVRTLDLLELSREYAASARRLLRHKPLAPKVIEADLHTYSLSADAQGYDVVYASSSLDSTPFVDEAIANLATLLKDERSVMIILQDVYPDPVCLAEVFRRRERAARITYGSENRFAIEEPDDMYPFVWVARQDGTRAPSSTYLLESIAEAGMKNNLSPLAQGRWSAGATAFPESPGHGLMKRMFRGARAAPGHNSVVGYMDRTVSVHDERIPGGALESWYCADVLVLGRRPISAGAPSSPSSP